MTLKASGNVGNGLAGKQNAPEDLGHLVGLILVPKGEGGYATDALALEEASWLDKLNKTSGSRYIMLPLAFDLVNAPEEDVYNTSGIGNVAFVRPGKLTQTIPVEVTPFVMSQLNSFNGVAWDIFKLTSAGYITGFSSDKAKFEPFSLTNFRVGSVVEADGAVNNTVPITFTHADPAEWNRFPSFLKPSAEGIDSGGDPSLWKPIDLKDPKAITSLVTVPLTAGTFTIFLEGYDKVPFELAQKENIIVKIESTGVVVPVTTLTPDANTPGLYDATITWTAVLHEVGMAPVGTTGAVQGFAGLAEDLQDVTPTA